MLKSAEFSELPPNNWYIKQQLEASASADRRLDIQALKIISDRLLADGDAYFPASDDFHREVNDRICAYLGSHAAACLDLDPGKVSVPAIDWNRTGGVYPDRLNDARGNPVDFPERLMVRAIGATAALLDTGVDLRYGYSVEISYDDGSSDADGKQQKILVTSPGGISGVFYSLAAAPQLVGGISDGLTA